MFKILRGYFGVVYFSFLLEIGMGLYFGKRLDLGSILFWWGLIRWAVSCFFFICVCCAGAMAHIAAIVGQNGD